MEVRDLLVRRWGPWQSAEWRNLGAGLNLLETPDPTVAIEVAELLGSGFAQEPRAVRGYCHVLPQQVRLRVAEQGTHYSLKANELGEWQHRSASDGPRKSTEPLPDCVADGFDQELVDWIFAPFERRPPGGWQREPERIQRLLTEGLDRTAVVPRPTSSDCESAWGPVRMWIEQEDEVQQELVHRTQHWLKSADALLKTYDLSHYVHAWQNACKDYQRTQTELESLQLRYRRLQRFHRLRAWHLRWQRIQGDRPALARKQMAAIASAVPRVQALQKQREELAKRHIRWQVRRKRYQERAGLSAAATATSASTSESPSVTAQEARKLLSQAKSVWQVERQSRRAQNVPVGDDPLVLQAIGSAAGPSPAHQARREELERELQQAQAILQTLREQRQETLLRQASASQVRGAMSPETPVFPAAWQRERDELQREYEALRQEAAAVRQQGEQVLPAGLMNEWQRLGILGLFVGGLSAIVIGIFLNLNAPLWPVVGVGFTAVAIGVVLRSSDARVMSPRRIGHPERLEQLQYELHENRRRWDQLEVSVPPASKAVLSESVHRGDGLPLAGGGQEMQWLETELEAASARVDVVRDQLSQLGSELSFMAAASSRASSPAGDGIAGRVVIPDTPITADQRRLLQQWKQRSARCLRDPEIVADDYSVRRVATRLRRLCHQIHVKLVRLQRDRKKYKHAQVQERRWEKELHRCQQRESAILRRLRCQDFTALLKLEKEGQSAVAWRQKVRRFSRNVRRRLPEGVDLEKLASFLQREEADLGDVDLPPLQERIDDWTARLQQGFAGLAKEIPREDARQGDPDWHELRKQWGHLHEPTRSWMLRGRELIEQAWDRRDMTEVESSPVHFYQSALVRLANDWGRRITGRASFDIGTGRDGQLLVRSDDGVPPRSLMSLSDSQARPILFTLRCAMAVGLARHGITCPLVILGSDLAKVEAANLEVANREVTRPDLPNRDPQDGERVSESNAVLLVLREVAQELQVIVVGDVPGLTGRLLRQQATTIAGSFKKPDPEVVAPVAPPVPSAPVASVPAPLPTPPREIYVERETYEVQGPVRFFHPSSSNGHLLP